MKTFYVQSFFFCEKRAVYGVTWKNMVVRQAMDQNTHIMARVLFILDN
jgi:hypothetical protein